MNDILDIVNKHYEDIFDEVVKVIGDDMFDITVEITTVLGETVRRSWKERNNNLRTLYPE